MTVSQAVPSTSHHRSRKQRARDGLSSRELAQGWLPGSGGKPAAVTTFLSEWLDPGMRAHGLLLQAQKQD